MWQGPAIPLHVPATVFTYTGQPGSRLSIPERLATCETIRNVTFPRSELASGSLPSLRTGADTPTLRLREKSAARLSQSKVRDSIRGEVDRLADWASRSQQRQEPDSRTQRPAEVERWITARRSCLSSALSVSPRL